MVCICAWLCGRERWLEVSGCWTVLYKKQKVVLHQTERYICFYLWVLTLFYFIVCVFVCIRLTSDVLAHLCCDEATFAGGTSRSLPSRSGLIPLCLLVISSCLTHTGLHHRCLGAFCMCASTFVWICVCAHLLLALSRTASQFVTTLPHISVSSAFSPFLSPSLPFSARV